jgi:hypothetical protein
LTTGIAPPCPATVAERAAILTESEGCDRATAEAKALAEVGYPSWEAFADARAAHISRLPEWPKREPSWQARARRAFLTEAEVAELANEVRAFLTTEDVHKAQRLEWTDVQLFGIDPKAPGRVESWGLITGLVLSPHNRRDSKGANHITKLDGGLDATGAMTVTPTGSRLLFDRFHKGLDLAVPFWECPALTGRNGNDATQLRNN